MPPKKKSGSAKSKEKKLQRKQEQVEVAASLAIVKAAYDVQNYMECFPAFQKYSRNGLDLTISFLRLSDMTKEDVQWTFDLMKECVEELYIRGGWGWNDKKKLEELTHESACFLIARDSKTGKPVGFTNFRFDLDDSCEVLYCYEIHLCSDIRRKGVGKFLMQILELIGHRSNMKKVVLTIFKENIVSNAFFRDKMKYVDDETSPLYFDPLNEDDYTYSILSKTLTRKPTKPTTAGAARPVKHRIDSSAEQAKHEQRTRMKVVAVPTSKENTKGTEVKVQAAAVSELVDSDRVMAVKKEEDCYARNGSSGSGQSNVNGGVLRESEGATIDQLENSTLVINDNIV